MPKYEIKTRMSVVRTYEIEASSPSDAEKIYTSGAASPADEDDDGEDIVMITQKPNS